MIPVPRSGMVLAAGLGIRMRPLTETLPKPLIDIAGRTLLDHAIDGLAAVGVARIVVNAHYKAEMIAAQIAARRQPQIDLAIEPELLETGGAVIQALPRLDAWFFVVNSDVLWRDGAEPALQRLACAADPDNDDVVLLLQPTARATGYDGAGDYDMAADGRPSRRRGSVAPYVFAGVQLLHRRAFAGVTERVFSLGRIYDRAEQAGRLRGVIHDGAWYHIGTPRGLAVARQAVTGN